MGMGAENAQPRSAPADGVHLQCGLALLRLGRPEVVTSPSIRRVSSVGERKPRLERPSAVCAAWLPPVHQWAEAGRAAPDYNAGRGRQGYEHAVRLGELTKLFPPSVLAGFSRLPA